MLNKKDIENDISIIQLFIKSGLVSSSKEVKRLMAGGSVKVNDILLNDSALKISALEDYSLIKLSVGKKRHALIKLAQIE
jgi:tyrosyl-tRNA synthetase